MHWDQNSLPKPYDKRRADATLNGLFKKASESDDTDLEETLSKPEARGLIESLAGNSPYLAQLIRRHPSFIAHMITDDPLTVCNDLLRNLANALPQFATKPDLMRALRQAKMKIALLTASQDIRGGWPVREVTKILSAFADLCLELTVAFLLHERMAAGELPWPDNEPGPATPDLTKNAGYCILALGKLGAFELNYSSDIDLIALYDEQTVAYTGKKSPGDCFARVTQDLVRILEDRTMDGYVFRTDFRLRPDPGATPIALSMGAAEYYYQTAGLNWERSAMIKARPAAGDLAAGEFYLERLLPFVWRKNLDFAAMQDIHAMKSRIHDFHGHRDKAIKGFDVKLGPGGIREIEFFAQIHQMIAGGRSPELRSRGTVETLTTLSAMGKISEAERAGLTVAYYFLRTIEHRLQMVQDEQTHSLPDNEDGLEAFACFMGYISARNFADDLADQLAFVRKTYDRILPEETGETTLQLPESGSQSLRDKLEDLKFQKAETAEDLISRWRSGRYRALRTARARALLENCLPRLLRAFSETAGPDRALTRFDDFLTKLPAGVQLFSLFQSNPNLFGLIARIMGSAPALADQLARRPALLDAVLDPGFYESMPERTVLIHDLGAYLKQARDYQDSMELSRRWLAERRFQIGVQILESLASMEEAGLVLSDLADAVVSNLIPIVEQEFQRRHGHFPGPGLGVIAMGSYGAKRLSFDSDLDIILLYDADFDCPQSDGPKPMGPSEYFSALGQQLITALSVMTAEGKLYEPDLRLRPSGGAGPLVVTLKTFESYQAEAAWTWEHMALTRARIVAGTPDFARRMEAAVSRALTQRREPEKLLLRVYDMRLKLRKEFGTENPWNVKHIPGGLIDIEFLAQYLFLREGESRPDIFTPDLIEGLNRLREYGALRATEADLLTSAYIVQRSIQGITRLCLSGEPQEKDFTDGFKTVLLRAVKQRTFTGFRKELVTIQWAVRSIYQQIIENPAQSVERREKPRNEDEEPTWQ